MRQVMQFSTLGRFFIEFKFSLFHGKILFLFLKFYINE